MDKKAEYNAQKQKNAAKVQALINGALAITRAFSKKPRLYEAERELEIAIIRKLCPVNDQPTIEQIDHITLTTPYCREDIIELLSFGFSFQEIEANIEEVRKFYILRNPKP